MRAAILAVILSLLAATDCLAQQFTLGQLDFKGNIKTKDPVIRRMIPLNQGDIFNLALWESGIETINRSGLFEPVTQDDVKMSFDQSRGVVDVVVNVRERDFQRIDFSGGAGTTGGAGLGLDYSNTNFTGRADRINARLRLGTRERVFAGSYSITTLTRIPVTIDWAGSYQRLEFIVTRAGGEDRAPLFIQRSAAASFTATIPIAGPRNALFAPTRAGLAYSFSSNNLTDFLAESRDVTNRISQSDIRIASLTPFVMHDTLDRSFDPTRGERLVVSGEVGARAIGGSLDIVSPAIDYRRFIPLSRSYTEPRVFGFRARLSHVAGFGEKFRAQGLSVIGDVPVFKRFFAGGEMEVRGYDINSIAPLALVERFIITTGNEPRLISSEARPVGGDTRFIFNAEYRQPLFWRLSAAAFMDFGASVNLRRLKEERFERATSIEPVGTTATVLTALRPLESEEEIFPAYRLSLGGELRFAVPLLNVPVRLIFSANPNAQRRLPDTFLVAPEKRFVFRFGFSRTL